ncbi:hypothetical protein GCM10010404_34980 [Nonomuraea africana]
MLAQCARRRAGQPPRQDHPQSVNAAAAEPVASGVSDFAVSTPELSYLAAGDTFGSGGPDG